MNGRVVIAGGGIGGLTLAIALARAKIECVVLERSPRLEPVGAGLILQINAMKAMRSIGLEDDVVGIGVPIRQGLGFAANGAKLSELDLAELERELGAPAIAMHRGRLHALLASKLGVDVVRTNARVVGFDESDDAIAAKLEGDERVHGSILVGADGLRSSTRAQWLGDVEPRYAGYTSWRGIAPVVGFAPPNTVMETWGRGLRFGMVEIGNGETYWFAVANAPHGEGEIDPHAVVAKRFATYPNKIPALIEATPGDRVFRTDIHDRDPIDRFCKGRLVLLGDAAHPMTPDLGQGACLAVEDAVVLAKCLTETDTFEAAFAAYEAKRVARARAIVLQSRQFGSLGKVENAFLVWLRNLALRMTPKSVVASRTRETLAFDP